MNGVGMPSAASCNGQRQGNRDGEQKVFHCFKLISVKRSRLTPAAHRSVKSNCTTAILPCPCGKWNRSPQDSLSGSNLAEFALPLVIIANAVVNCEGRLHPMHS